MSADTVRGKSAEGLFAVIRYWCGLVKKKRILNVFQLFPEKYCSRFQEFSQVHLQNYDHQFVALEANCDASDSGELLSVKGLRGKSRLSSLRNFATQLFRRDVDLFVFHNIIYSIPHLVILAMWFLFAGGGSRSLWMPWGADIYHYQNQTGLRGWLKEVVRRAIISRFHFIGSVFPQECAMLKLWYRTRSIDLMVMYPNPIEVGERPPAPPAIVGTKIRVLVGNSADPGNNHDFAFDLLKKYGGSIQIICPLSYGDMRYAQEVAQLGRQIFGDDFEAITKFEPAEVYRERLESIDMVCFAHNRQQGWGNIVQLLDLEKAVFLKDDVITYRYLKDNAYPVQSLSMLESLEIDQLRRLIENQGKVGDRIRQQFSEKNVANSWNDSLETIFMYSAKTK